MIRVVVAFADLGKSPLPLGFEVRGEQVHDGQKCFRLAREADASLSLDHINARVAVVHDESANGLSLIPTPNLLFPLKSLWTRR